MLRLTKYSIAYLDPPTLPQSQHWLTAEHWGTGAGRLPATMPAGRQPLPPPRPPTTTRPPRRPTRTTDRRPVPISATTAILTAAPADGPRSRSPRWVRRAVFILNVNSTLNINPDLFITLEPKIMILVLIGRTHNPKCDLWHKRQVSF